MSWILDVLVIAVFLGTIITYTKQGFVKAVLGFGKTLISAIVAAFFGPKLSIFIADKLIGNRIVQQVYSILLSLYSGSAETFDLSQLFEQLPEGFVRMVQTFGGDLSELEAQYGNMTAATEQNLMSFSQSIAQPITRVISDLFGYLLVFLAAYVCFALFASLICKVFEIPMLKQINHVLGFILGFVFGAVNTFIFCFFGNYLIPFLAAITSAFVAEDLIAGSILFRAIVEFKLF